MNEVTHAAIQTQGPRSLDASLRRKAFSKTQPGYRERANSFVRAVALIAMLGAFSSAARASATTHTTTTLAVAPGASVAAGIPVTLTATVTFTNGVTSGSVTAGTVFFCNASAARCEDSAILGTAQLTNAGSATINLKLGVGAYSINAAYQQDLFPGSVSGNQALTVSPNASYSTSLSIAASGNPPGPYTLTGTVAAFGTTPPTGTVSFTHISDSTIVGSQALNPATLGFTFLNAAGSPVPVGFEPEISVLGDFNNDGIPDLAVASNATNAISILLGNGDGTFQAQTTILPSSFGALSIAVGDFNRDGDLDLAVVIPGDGKPGDGTGTVNILLGNGNGTFQPPHAYIVGTAPVSIAMADFNGNGFLDLAVLNSGDNNVSVLLSVGDGTFTLEQSCPIFSVPGTHAEGVPNCSTATFPVGHDARQIVTADFNVDGIPDLVVTNSGDNTVSVLLGLGDGTFFTGATVAVGNDVSDVVVADFNGDGFPDIAVTNQSANSMTVLLGRGNGAFPVPMQATYSTGSIPIGIAVGDFNGDGKMDLAVADLLDNTISLFLNKADGTGTFQPQVTFPAGRLPLRISVGDLNGDGIPDLVAINAHPSISDTFGATILLAAQTESATATGVVISGMQNVIANYPGDTVHAASQSTSIPIGPIATTTTLNVSPSPAIAGQPVILTATVSPVPAGTPGTVQFFDGAVSLGTATVNSAGVATLTTSSLPAGALSLTAVYSGNAGTLPSTSAAQNETVQTATTTALNVVPNPAIAGQPVTFTATVGPAPTGTPLGTVSFFNGATLLGSGTANSSGVATFTTSSLPIGALSLSATYLGNTGTAGSTSTVQSVTVKTATTTTLSVAPNPAVAGQAVTFTAAVTPAPTGTPAGTVSFFNGATLLGMGTIDGSGVATFTTSSLPSGALSLTATYSSNSGFGGSTSSVQSETVNPQTVTTTTLNVAPNPATAGVAVTFTATITPAPTGAPAGTVAFHNGITLVGMGTVNGAGIATFTTSTLLPGTSGFTASYSGNAGFAGSISTVQSVTVNAGTITTTTALTSSPNPGTAGQPVTLTVTVAPAPTGTPAGTVNFLNGALLLGMSTLNGAGVATFTISSLPSGTDVITAVYSGNASSAGSTSAPLSLMINPTYAIIGPTTPITLAAGGMVNININVAPVGSSFTSVVTMSASGLPTGATASFNPTTVTPGAAGAVTVLTVALSASAKLVQEPTRNQPFVPFGFAAAGMCLFVRKRKQLAKSLAIVLVFAALAAGTLAIIGCGTTSSGTKSQTVVVTVTGTSGAVHQSTTITLIVK